MEKSKNYVTNEFSFDDFFNLQKLELERATSGMFRLCYNRKSNQYIATAYVACGRGYRIEHFFNADYNLVRDACYRFADAHEIRLKNGLRLYYKKLNKYEK